VLLAESTASAAKSRQQVRGRKIVITTGRHDVGSRPARSRRAASRTSGLSRRAHRQRQVADSNAHLDDDDDDDEWEVDAAVRVCQQSTAERLTSSLAHRPLDHDVTLQEGCLLFLS